jgi:hypothetical protein
MASRNRTAGNNWERKLVDKFKKAGFKDVITTRLGSRELDGKKIDIMNSNTSKEGRLPYNVQAKNYAKSLQYGSLLEELPTEPGIINIVAHKQTAKVNGKFMPRGEYAILNLDDFMSMVTKLRAYEQRDARGELVQPTGK